MGIDITILFDKENVKLVNALNMAIIGQGGKVIKPNTSVTKQQTQISTHINHMYVLYTQDKNCFGKAGIRKGIN